MRLRLLCVLPVPHISAHYLCHTKGSKNNQERLLIQMYGNIKENQTLHDARRRSQRKLSINDAAGFRKMAYTINVVIGGLTFDVAQTIKQVQVPGAKQFIYDSKTNYFSIWTKRSNVVMGVAGAAKKKLNINNENRFRKLAYSLTLAMKMAEASIRIAVEMEKNQEIPR